MKGTESRRVYLTGFNAVRLIAACFVIVDHIEQVKHFAGIAPNVWATRILHSMGSESVNLFFVLSGFLITYLLLREKRQRSTISVKDFYIRRLLRIAPLYLLTVTLSLVVAPLVTPLWMRNGSTPAASLLADYFSDLSHHYLFKLFLFYFAMPHVALALFPRAPFCAQSWSVGVEENFYLAWPWVLRSWSKHLTRVAVGIILLKLALVVAFVKFPRVVAFGNPTLMGLHSSVMEFLEQYRIESMAIGALGARAFFENQKWLRIVVNPSVTRASLPLLIVSLLFG
ncbi:MAG: acyltransferase, partial [Elusimicrobia bacterium]|nr:acyltransferase [Elusimicrobiota bacterium]